MALHSTAAKYPNHASSALLSFKTRILPVPVSIWTGMTRVHDRYFMAQTLSQFSCLDSMTQANEELRGKSLCSAPRTHDRHSWAQHYSQTTKNFRHWRQVLLMTNTLTHECGKEKQTSWHFLDSIHNFLRNYADRVRTAFTYLQGSRKFLRRRNRSFAVPLKILCRDTREFLKLFCHT